MNIPEFVKKDLQMINAVSEDLKMNLYIAGGFPRDLIFGIEIDENTDLDVTEKNGNAFDLAFFVSAKYNLMEPRIYGSSGTALVIMESGRSVEFHNSFYNVPHIIDQLYALNIEPTPLNKDVYSRDFTINTLLYDVKNDNILDITKKGIYDIQNKIKSFLTNKYISYNM
jgi:poly(A) polymerase/tRNA nucleotidyltransferase (CCA-adding enzyme)